MKFVVTVSVKVDPDANFLAVDDEVQSLEEAVELALREIDDMQIESVSVERTY